MNGQVYNFSCSTNFKLKKMFIALNVSQYVILSFLPYFVSLVLKNMYSGEKNI